MVIVSYEAFELVLVFNVEAAQLVDISITAHLKLPWADILRFDQIIDQVGWPRLLNLRLLLNLLHRVAKGALAVVLYLEWILVWNLGVLVRAPVKLDIVESHLRLLRLLKADTHVRVIRWLSLIIYHLTGPPASNVFALPYGFDPFVDRLFALVELEALLEFLLVALFADEHQGRVPLYVQGVWERLIFSHL